MVAWWVLIFILVNMCKCIINSYTPKKRKNGIFWNFETNAPNKHFFFKIYFLGHVECGHRFQMAQWKEEFVWDRVYMKIKHVMNDP